MPVNTGIHFLLNYRLAGGCMQQINSMPTWAKVITKFNPVSYFIDVMRMVVLKGSRLGDTKPHLFTVFGFAVILNGWAVIAIARNHKSY